MKTKFEEFMEDPEQRRVYEQESLAFEAAELISARMEDQGVSRTELARRIGRSNAFVTQVLSGSRDMTLRTVADLAFALECKVELSRIPLRKQQGEESFSCAYRPKTGLHRMKRYSAVKRDPAISLNDETRFAA